jgi:hypothetical protein
MKRMEIAGVVFCGILVLFTVFIAFQGGISNSSESSIHPHAQPVTTTPVIPSITPVPVTSMLQKPTMVITQDSLNDQKFIEAAEACYEKTPVINNVATHLAFVSCMQKTPNPTGECAKNFKHYALEFTNDDDTTSGYERETYNVHLAQQYYYSNCLSGYLSRARMRIQNP